MSLMFSGLGVSRGIAIGRIHRLQRAEIDISENHLTSADIPAEIERFHHAVETAKQQLHDVIDNIPMSLNVEISTFIETHLLMLDDHVFAEGTVRFIRDRQCNAEWALKLQMDTIEQVFDSMEDEYLATRKDDIQHVVQRILHALQHQEAPHNERQPNDWTGDIVLADDLAPADTILMQHQGVAGFATESGGPLSHTAILARSLNIPAVVGLHNAQRYIRDGEHVVIDGNIGMLLAAPDERAIEHFTRKRNALTRKRRELVKLKSAPSATACGTAIELQANIETDDDIRALHRVNASGVGLYRTEFLFLNRADLPSEDEHYANYIKILKALKGAPLTVRTVDIGADKEIQQEQAGQLAHNPALGLRGIRRCLSEPAMFLPQLRAILRASAKGPINILLPMLTRVDEILRVRSMIDSCKAELRRSGIDLSDNLQLGGMIEVPSSAIAARQFAEHLDFMSIGTNDLIQYTLAMDRLDDLVNYLYDPLNPAVLRLIANVIKAGNNANIPVSMCGEMAGDSRYTRLLLCMGLRIFSMPANSILEVKHILQQTDIDKLATKHKSIMHCHDRLRQATLLEKLNSGLDLIDC